MWDRIGGRTLACVSLAAVLTAGACSSSTDGGAPPANGGTTPPATSAVATGGPVLPQIAKWTTTKGTDFRTYFADGQGRALQLRGFNIKTRDPLKDASDELLKAGQERGFNLLRLSIYWDQFEPEQGRFDDAYLDSVRTVLDRAAAHGIVVILDFHQDVFGPKFGDHGIPEWATRDEGIPYTKHEVWLQNYLEPAVQAAWDHLYEDEDLRQAQINAWTTVAKRYKDHPALVGYDLLNEPFGRLRAGEDLVKAASRVQEVQLTAMYQRLYDALHQVDPDHWVFFEPPNVASLGIPVALGTVKGEKLAYYPHFYDPNIETATYAPGGEINGFDPAFFEKYEKAIRPYIEQHDYPTLFGEWGIAHPERPGMDEFVARSIALMDRVGSGWTVFNWCSRGDGYCPLNPDLTDRPAIGQIVQPWARATAGAPTSFGFDPKTKVLRVVFSDNDAKGTTDIAVPPSVYPDGFTVEASDAEGSWSSETDTKANVVRVTTPKTGGAHAVCIKPKGAPAGCAA